MSTIKAETITKIRTANNLYISHPQGKMHDIPAITESCLCNDFCACMAKKSSTVCAHCYAQNSLKWETAAREHYARNTQLLSESIIPESMLPRIYSDIARFETHGDWVNLNSAINEMNIAKFNPNTHFTVWTKRADLLFKLAKAGYQQPRNLHIKLSSPRLNHELPQTVKEKLASYGWTVSYFTVVSLAHLQEQYTKEDLQTKNIITCGGRDCRSCMRCYGPHPKEDVVELLKQDTAKAKRFGLKIN